MGTRGMIGIKVDDKKIGIYNHFDSYPEGLGKEVVEFIYKHLNTEGKIAEFALRSLALTPIKESDAPSQREFDYYNSLGESELGATRARTEWYATLRNFQFDETLVGILSGKLMHFAQKWSFLQDSLSCEFAYVLDMNTNTLEFYKGYQHDPMDDSHYLPCKMVGSLPFDKLSVDAMMELYREDQKPEEPNKVDFASSTEPTLIKYMDLYLRDAKHDKVYNLNLFHDPDGTYRLTCLYGRRGTKLQATTKVAGASYTEASNLYHKVLDEKAGKGYKISAPR